MIIRNRRQVTSVQRDSRQVTIITVQGTRVGIQVELKVIAQLKGYFRTKEERKKRTIEGAIKAFIYNTEVTRNMSNR